MKATGRVRPSKPASGLGLVVGLIFIGIGLFVVIPQFGAFGVLWTLIAVAITVFNAVNVFSSRGVAGEVVDFETDAGVPVATGATETGSATAYAGALRPVESGSVPSPERRLTTLDDLKAKGLVSESEYEEQRRRILDEL